MLGLLCLASEEELIAVLLILELGGTHGGAGTTGKEVGGISCGIEGFGAGGVSNSGNYASY